MYRIQTKYTSAVNVEVLSSLIGHLSGHMIARPQSLTVFRIFRQWVLFSSRISFLPFFLSSDLVDAATVTKHHDKYHSQFVLH